MAASSDRFAPPVLIGAASSPAGILAAGAGIGAGLALGLPVVLAILLGVMAVAVRVAVAVARRGGPVAPEIDSFSLSEPWRKFVQDAQVTSRRFNDIVASTPAGPMRERMGHIAGRITAGVDECWAAAGHGDRLSKARARLDIKDTAKELQKLRAAGDLPAGSSAAGTAQALQSKLDSAARMDAIIADTRDRLRLLDARLDEALARAVELSVDTSRLGDLTGLNDEVEGVVGEMETLRIGLDQT